MGGRVEGGGGGGGRPVGQWQPQQHQHQHQHQHRKQTNASETRRNEKNSKSRTDGRTDGRTVGLKARTGGPDGLLDSLAAPPRTPLLLLALPPPRSSSSKSAFAAHAAVAARRLLSSLLVSTLQHTHTGIFKANLHEPTMPGILLLWLRLLLWHRSLRCVSFCRSIVLSLCTLPCVLLIYVLLFVGWACEGGTASSFSPSSSSWCRSALPALATNSQ